MKNYFFTIIFFFFITFSINAQNIWFVNQNATGANTGISWQNAFLNLQDALNNSILGDQIWVAKGSYLPTTNFNRSISFNLKNGVQLLGGFEGNETNLTQRNLTLNPTILSGNIGNPQDSTDNCYTILYLDHPDTTTIIDGINFKHGYAYSDTTFNFFSSTLCGAAVYANGQNGMATPIFRNCNFERNVAKGYGGAVFLFGRYGFECMPRFTNCNFSNNRAFQSGGAVYCFGGSFKDYSTEFKHCSLTNCSAEKYGGGIYFRMDYGNVNFQVEGCSFEKCHSKLYGTAILTDRNDLGFLDFSIDSSYFKHNGNNRQPTIMNFTNYLVNIRNFTIQNSYFFDNSNGINNQNLPFEGMIASSTKDALPTAENCIIINNIFDNNSDSYGTFAFDQYITGKIENNVALNNLSGSIYNFTTDSDLFINRCMFMNNKAVSTGSKLKNCIFIKNNTISPLAYGELYQCIFFKNRSKHPIVFTRERQISNCIFLDNFCEYESEIFGTTIIPKSSGAVQNSIFTNDISIIDGVKSLQSFPIITDYNDITSKLTLKNSLYDVPINGQPNINLISGNIYTTDPLFKDTANLDFHLLPCSVAINAGDNYSILDSTDFTGSPRIQDNIIDIGPYEHDPVLYAQMTKIMASCGLNANGSVKFNVENGCPPYNYIWQNANNAGNDTTNLAAGNYQFTITDARGKQLTEQIIIPQSNTETTISVDSFVCENEATAMLAAVVSGAANPIVFTWNTGQTDPILDNLGAGTYILTTTDALGCVGLDTAYVEEALPTNPQFTVNDASGLTQPNGSIILNLINGLPPFQFLWSNGNTTGNPNNLLPGEYLLTITNGIGCETNYNFVVSYVSPTEPTGFTSPVSVFPNPASHQVFLKWGLYEKFELFDQTGKRVIYREKINEKSIFSVENLPNGTYSFVFSQKSGNQILGKLVVAR